MHKVSLTVEESKLCMLRIRTYSIWSIRSSLNKYPSGPGCSKQTMSLVNVSLKFQTLISQVCQYFLSEKMRGSFAVQELL